MSAVAGITLGSKLVDVLGLTGQQVFNIKIEVPVDSAVRVTVEKFVTDEEANEIVRVLREYELELKG